MSQGENLNSSRMKLMSSVKTKGVRFYHIEQGCEEFRFK